MIKNIEHMKWIKISFRDLHMEGKLFNGISIGDLFSCYLQSQLLVFLRYLSAKQIDVNALNLSFNFNTLSTLFI